MTTNDPGSTCYTFEKPVSSDEIVKMAKDIIEEKFLRVGPQLYSSAQAKEYLVLKMSCYKREVLACIFLDQGHRVIAFEELFWGTINRNTIYPREIAKRAFIHSAAALILVHNHPSGGTEPSQPDIELTDSIKKAMALIEIRLIDHLIVGGIDCVSLADLGMI